LEGSALERSKRTQKPGQKGGSLYLILPTEEKKTKEGHQREEGGTAPWNLERLENVVRPGDSGGEAGWRKQKNIDEEEKRMSALELRGKGRNHWVNMIEIRGPTQRGD